MKMFLFEKMANAPVEKYFKCISIIFAVNLADHAIISDLLHY